MSGERPSGCVRVLGRLPLLLDGALPALDEARDRGHLEACGACRGQHDEYERLLARLPAAWAAGVVAESRRLSEEVLRELGCRPAPRRARRFAPSPLLAAAVAAGLLLFLRLCFGQDLSALPEDGAAVELEALLRRLPSWSQVWGGLEQLSRWVS